jgi:hypothetical protein
VQISWGKPRSFPRSPAGFTAMALDGYGLRDWLPARPTIPASDPIPVRRVAISLHASFRRSLAVPPLRFARTSPPSGCTGDFHPQAAGHAQHTAWPCGPPPLSGGCGLDRAGPSNRRSTIGMKDAGLLFPSQSMDWVKSLFTDGPDPQNAGFAARPRPKKEQQKEAHSALDANTIM